MSDLKKYVAQRKKKDEKFADYIFTSRDINVNAFEVLKDEVSDHSALLLDFK